MKIPSKVGGFNQEYYPLFNANEPSSSAEAWAAGTDVAAATMQMSQLKREVKKRQGGLNRLRTGIKPVAAAEEKKSAGGDTSALEAEIAQLRSQLAAAQAGSASSGKAASAEDLSTRPVLGYWKIRGLAAQIRYMFYFLNVDFEDKLYEVHGETPDWDRSEWLDEKFSLGLEFPNLPYLIDGETKITETVAIMQYIA